MALPQTNINAFTDMNPPTRDDPVDFDPRAEYSWNCLKASQPQFNLLATQVNNMATAANQSATDAAGYRDTAKNYRDTAQTYRNEAEGFKNLAGDFRNQAGEFRDQARSAAATLRGTSVNALTIGAGSKSLTTETGRQFDAGQTLKLVVVGNGEAWMSGRVTSYNSATGALVVNVLAVATAYAGQGSNTWNLYVAGEVGPAGPTGGLSGGNATGAINERGADNTLPSASVMDIWSQNGNYITVTGNVPITGFTNAPQRGARRTLLFAGSPQLVNSANMLIRGGTVQLNTADEIDVIAEVPNVFRVTVRRADGKATVGTRLVVEVITAGQMWTVKATDFEVEMCGGGQSGSNSSDWGGGCGGYVKKQFVGAIIGATAAIVIGSQGASQTTGTANNGGPSSFTLAGFTTLNCGGGTKGNAIATGGDVNIPGKPGLPRYAFDFDYNYDVSGFVSYSQSGAGADGPLGNGAVFVGGSGNGIADATGYGSGGTAGRQNAASSQNPYGTPNNNGSAGRPGVCIIRYYV